MGRVERPNLTINAGVIALTSMPESIKASNCWAWNWTGYRIKGTRCKASGLAVTDVEVAETATSFLEIRYSHLNSGLFCCRYKWLLGSSPCSSYRQCFLRCSRWSGCFLLVSLFRVVCGLLSSSSPSWPFQRLLGCAQIVGGRSCLKA